MIIYTMTKIYVKSNQMMKFSKKNSKTTKIIILN